MKIGSIVLISLGFLALAQTVNAQTTAFNYQGRLTDAGNPANGAFQMQFKLFDSLGGAGQVGSTIPDVPVTVNQGAFSVRLDFGANALSGANRWIEIGVRRNAGEPYTTLAPREQIASSPYAVRTISAGTADTATNALSLGGVAANQFVQTNDPRLSDARNPLPNSPSYIQNSLAQQAASNFNVSGSGTIGSLTTGGAATFGGVGPPANAPAGQGRIYFDSAQSKFRVSQNGGGFVDLVGSGGVTGSGNTSTIALWSAGTTLGNSAISQFGNNIGIGAASPNGRLGIANSPAWTSHNWAGSIELENASAIGWKDNPSGFRFGIGRTTDGLVMFRTPVSIGTTTGAPPQYDFKIDNAGNVGIGNTTLNMALDAKLTVVTTTYGIDHTNGVGTLSTFVGGSVPNNVPTGGWLGTRSAHPLYFFANLGAPKMTVATNGNVGIGTITPVHKLEVNGVTSLGPAGGVYGYMLDQPAPGPFPTIGFNNFWNGSGYAAGRTGTGGVFQYQNGDGKLIYYTAPSVSAGSLFSFTPRMTVLQNGNVGIGTTAPTQKLEIVGTTKTGVLEITGGSDLAEHFEFAEPVKQGMVVAIDPTRPGKLAIAQGAYNRRVVGVISGANDLAAGLVLPDVNNSRDSMPVALSGRVWVYADANIHPITLGDLLTTSETPGHAMRVKNFRKAGGAVIGKAMTELRSGKGLVLIVITLQ